MAGSRANSLAKESERELDCKASKCCQEDLFGDDSTLAGRMFVNVKLVEQRKAQRSTGSTTGLSGTKSDVRFQRPSGSWNKKQEPQRMSGNGKEALLRILSVKANGMEVASA